MQSVSETVRVETLEKQQLIDLTSSIEDVVRASGVRCGMLGVYSRHTTAGVFVTEYQAALNDDVMDFFRRVVEEGLPYKHNCPELSDCERRNAAAHLRTLLLGQSVLVPVVDRKPGLGRFQSILLAEFDGPRDRSVCVQVLGT